MLTILGYILGFIVLYRLLRYLTTPLARKLGIYKYYSPMFMTAPIFPRIHEIHLGTSWDFFKLERTNPKIVLIHLAKGLINLCDAIEAGKVDPEIKFKGNTHYIKEKTIAKFGFKARNLNVIEWFLFSLNYLELCLLRSIAYKRLVIVRLGNIKIMTIKGKEMVEFKEKYQRYVDTLTSDKKNPRTINKKTVSDKKMVKVA